MWGLLGSGNVGNDGSLESMLGYLRSTYPDATIDAMTTGPEGLRAQYGLDAVPMLWCQRYEDAPRPVAVLTKILGKVVDVVRIAAWTRRHDVVIISGAGPLEDSLPLHAWGLPYALFVLAASGRVLGTKVAFVSVGASRIKKRATRGSARPRPGSPSTALFATTSRGRQWNGGALTPRATPSIPTLSTGCRCRAMPPPTR